MRAVNFVENIEFDFQGPVLRNALAVGDVDNDGNNELVIGNENGEVAIFKGVALWQTIHTLGFVSCIVIGDILNCKQNCLTIISADGWCHIYCCMKNMKDNKKNHTVLKQDSIVEETETTDGLIFSAEDISPILEEIPSNTENDINNDDQLQCIHIQRIPANSKVALLGDVDGDGAVELILGLTDRVVRSYRWISNPYFVSSTDIPTPTQTKLSTSISGKLLGLNKWECANQIGSVTLHHSSDGSPCLLVAQPGGTFMRIKCQPENVFGSVAENVNISENNSLQSESFDASLVDYQFLGLSRMRNQNISTEIIGDLQTKYSFNKNAMDNNGNKNDANQVTKTERNKGQPYAVATLDGTIMLVEDEIILWAIQVDHQTFALSKLDITGNGSDDIIVCSWDGQTYILDQEKNSVRFQLDEPVQAFCSGYYSIIPGKKTVPCLVYVTFWNKLYIFFNTKLDSMILKKFNPDLSTIDGIQTLITHMDRSKKCGSFERQTKQKIIRYVLYGLKKRNK